MHSRILVIGDNKKALDFATKFASNGNSVKVLYFGEKPIEDSSSYISALDERTIFDYIFVSVSYADLYDLAKVLIANPSKVLIFHGFHTNAYDFSTFFQDKKIFFSLEDQVNHLMIGSPQALSCDCLKPLFETTTIQIEQKDNICDYLLTCSSYFVPMALAYYQHQDNIQNINLEATLKNIMMATTQLQNGLIADGCMLEEVNKDYCLQLIQNFYSFLNDSQYIHISYNEVLALADDLYEIVRQHTTDLKHFVALTNH